MIIMLGTTRKLVYLASLLVTVCMVSAGTGKQTESSWNRIFTRKEEKPTYKYTVLAAVENTNTQELICGGVIIAPHNVLSVGDCQFEISSKTMVRVGVQGGMLYSVGAVFHYRTERLTTTTEAYYVFTLVITKENIDFNKNVGQACLPKWDGFLNQQVTALEWRGKTNEFHELNLVVFNEISWKENVLLMCRGENGKHPKDYFRGGLLLQWNPYNKGYTLVGISPFITEEMKKSLKKPDPSAGIFYNEWRGIEFDRFYLNLFHYTEIISYHVKKVYTYDRICTEK